MDYTGPTNRVSRWRKLEFALLFIHRSKYCAQISRATQTEGKRSKWVLLRNVVWAVNFFKKVTLKKLRLKESLVMSLRMEKENSLNEKVIMRRERRIENRHWKKIRNVINWIR